MAHADLPPALPAEHGRAVEEHDAADLGLDAGVEPGIGAGDEQGERIVSRGRGTASTAGGQVELDRLQHGGEQVGLVGELVVQGAAGDAGGLGDALGADVGVAVLGEQPAGGRDNAARVAAVRSAWVRRVMATLTSMQSVRKLRTRCTEGTSRRRPPCRPSPSPPGPSTTDRRAADAIGPTRRLRPRVPRRQPAVGPRRRAARRPGRALVPGRLAARQPPHADGARRRPLPRRRGPDRQRRPRRARPGRRHARRQRHRRRDLPAAARRRRDAASGASC